MTQEEDKSFEGEVVRLNPEYEDSFIEGNLNMVGKIISDKEVSFRTCKAALLEILGNPKGAAISDVGRNKVLISFRDASKGVQIRKAGPWSNRENLLNLQIWNGRQSVCSVIGVNRAKAILVIGAEQRQDEKNRESTDDKLACEGERGKTETSEENWVDESCTGLGEMPANVINRMRKGKDKLQVAREVNSEVGQNDATRLDLAQANENNEALPFLLRTTKNEVDLAGLMVTEEETRHLQPRVLIRDFNDIILQDEKVGLHPKPSNQIVAFRNFVHENALLDLDLQGMKYTWFSNPTNGYVTKERLDRVLVNWEWRKAFQHATLSALPPISLDHTPLVLNVNPRGEGWNMNKLKMHFDEASVDKIIRTPEPESSEHALLLCPWTRTAWFRAQIQCCPTVLTFFSFEVPAKVSTNITRTGSRVTWRPPLEGWIKRNVDAAFVEAHSLGATAAVFRDHNGTLLSGINSFIVATLPLAAEALAVRTALIMSQNFQMQKVIIESDNQILIQALKSHTSIAKIQVILEDILHLARGILSYGFTWEVFGKAEAEFGDDTNGATKVAACCRSYKGGLFDLDLWVSEDGERQRDPGANADVAEANRKLKLPMKWGQSQTLRRSYAKPKRDLGVCKH
ncbi:hypothetical protein Ahy_B07g087000 [Arachis hypogaea]|uniref:RNase H type-1 domain-containing protein n=1 Tax=Arachis hypogaea TaxID=3818 RepID=A0A444YB46_ARAHY|nr:hypothetical protein Ahy_B07g087000 [Arachis hypogaea]